MLMPHGRQTSTRPGKCSKTCKHAFLTHTAYLLEACKPLGVRGQEQTGIRWQYCSMELQTALVEELLARGPSHRVEHT